jgi:RHS repeat-associated protein
VLEEHVDGDFDSNHYVDRVSQNVWGLRYIDDLVLRRVNANYAGGTDTDYSDTGDTAWEQYLADHQFSVVAAVNGAGTLQFRLAYDAYGEARHSWAKDIDGDGDVDATDGSLASTASTSGLNRIHQANYNADADWDRNGIVNSTDVAAFGSGSYASALPGGALAENASDLNVGFCGYRFNGEIGAYTVRFRHYDPTPGVARWLERDPAGYVDGPSLYQYCSQAPHEAADPFGLIQLDAVRPGERAWWAAVSQAGLPPGYKVASGDGFWDDELVQFEAARIAAGDDIAQVALIVGAGVQIAVSFMPGTTAITVFHDLSEGQYVNAALDSIAVGGLSAGLLRAVRHAHGFGRLIHAAKYGIDAYDALRKQTVGKGLNVHHIIQKRFAHILGKTQRKMLGVVVTRAEHAVFDQAWLDVIKRGTTPSVSEIRRAAREIYKDYPELLKAAERELADCK